MKRFGKYLAFLMIASAILLSACAGQGTQYKLSFSQPTNGSIVVKVDGQDAENDESYDAGTVVSVALSANTGYRVGAYWSTMSLLSL